MAGWIRLCAAGDAPSPGEARELEVHGVAVCLANVDGALAAVDNVCPHRAGPLAEGWIENGKIVCPWHAWGFDLKTGECVEERSRVKVYPLQPQDHEILIDLS